MHAAEVFGYWGSNTLDEVVNTHPKNKSLKTVKKTELVVLDNQHTLGNDDRDSFHDNEKANNYQTNDDDDYYFSTLLEPVEMRSKTEKRKKRKKKGSNIPNNKNFFEYGKNNEKWNYITLTDLYKDINSVKNRQYRENTDNFYSSCDESDPNINESEDIGEDIDDDFEPINDINELILANNKKEGSESSKTSRSTTGSNLVKRKVNELTDYYYGNQTEEFKNDDDFCDEIRKIPQSNNLKQLYKRRKKQKRQQSVNKKNVEINTDSLTNIQCFGCQMYNTGDSKIQVKKIDILLKLIWDNYGQVDNYYLSKMAHEYFKNEIYLPSKNRPGNQIDNWTTSQILNHIENHTQEPRIWICESIKTFKLISKGLESMSFFKKLPGRSNDPLDESTRSLIEEDIRNSDDDDEQNNICISNKDNLKLLLDINRRIESLYKLKATQMNFYNKNYLIDFERNGNLINTNKNFSID